MALRAPLRIYLLGSFRVESDAGVIKVATKPTAALLAYLALHRPRAFSRAELATLFWGSEAAHEHRHRVSRETPDRLAGKSFRKALSSLRHTLGGETILDQDDGKAIALNPDTPLWVDVEVFRKEADALLSGDATRSPDETLALYRGDLLQDFQDDPDAPWLDAQRAAVRELYLKLCLHLAQDARTRGEWAKVVKYAQAARERDPYSETAYQHLMVGHARLGDTEHALQLYAELERVLDEDLGTTPAAVTRNLYRHIERNAARPHAAELSNVPTPLTPFLGRETELERLRAMLQDARLVTLVGAGGSGKTRLAIQIAREQLRRDDLAQRLYNDGVWWVRLEELDKDTGSVAQSIAQVLGARGDAGRPLLETLVAQLRDSAMLLVLDNCEHLIADCARVSEELLTACPQIKILATSRQRLHVPGEVAFNVSPLSLPEERAQLAALEKSEAVRFFMHYARHARGDFALRDTNAPAVAQICRRLDGIPLALELAAARVKTLSPDYIAAHLDERFELLAAQHHIIPRHQTLRAVLDWSYDLLEPPEQRVFETLSVFAARFTLQAAEYVCNGDGSHARDILEGLVDKSLVLVEFDADDAVRYRLLETIREYAREKLAASPERLAATNERLSKYYLQFSQEHAKDYLAVEDEWNNIAAGMAVAYERQDWQPLLDYGQAVTDALFARGLYTDARRIIPWVITAADREEEQERSLEAMYRWGTAYIRQASYDDARQIMTRLLELSEMARDEQGKGMAYFGLGWIAVERSGWAEAKRFLEQSLRIRSELHDDMGVAEVLLELSRIEHRQDQSENAEHLALQALSLLDRLPLALHKVYALQRLALIARDRTDYRLATQYCEQAIHCAETLQVREEMALLLYLRGQIAQASGDFQSALVALEQSRAVFHEIGARKTEAYVLDLLGSILAELDQLADAEAAGRMALDFLKQVHDEQGIIASSRRLGITLAKMNRIPEACALWREALVRAERTNDMRVPYLKALLAQYCGG